ncbi:sigma-70 family RNA polymerase sigma factor [Pseudonocardia humida]|uniref:Sigma-70 family RNA polymerase sigma factor n=1 Tax=Pseudonocardia humida TaxID=2800819 RepID=A0ABT0ZTS3_9PSEU|nr:sigma-70 family RNA polymerase sigma factor [Pseudonocardia humida]MCO1654074.1 sigma-70 family RNA polymerase sigma factor [Pseudonocardia humida]
MDERRRLAERFEADRPRLRAVAHRMLGSAAEADDALQQAWLRVDRAGAEDVENLDAWLTTVVARVCLNMLRSRDSRREQPLGEHLPEPATDPGDGGDPEREAVLADSVGLALLVVLDTLAPAERLAFVLHDMFAVPFDEIGPMIERSPTAARQLASRARRRVRGGGEVADADLARQREVVDAFLAASRGGDLGALVALLDPDVVLRADPAVGPTPAPVVLHGRRNVARGALLASERVRSSRPALVDGSVGLVMAPHGRLVVALRFTFTDARITGIEVIAEPDRLRGLRLGLLD